MDFPGFDEGLLEIEGTLVVRFEKDDKCTLDWRGISYFGSFPNCHDFREWKRQRLVQDFPIPPVVWSNTVKTLTIMKCPYLEFPTPFGNLTDLKYLSIDWGGHEGRSLPATIENFQKLEKLEIRDVGMTNQLPVEVGNLPLLKEFTIERIYDLTGLPAEIGNLQNLKVLNIYWCEQLQTFPAEIGNLSNLTELRLDRLGLEELPAEILNLSNLTKLTLISLRLEEIPAEIGNLSNLTELRLDDLELEELPAEIGNLNELTELTLDTLDLEELPGSVGNLTKLRKLRLANININSLPVEFGQLLNLKELELYALRQLQSIPLESGQLPNLEKVTLRENGSLIVPQEIFSSASRSLKSLIIKDSQLIEFPSPMPSLHKIEKIYVSPLSFEETYSLQYNQCGRQVLLNFTNGGDHANNPTVPLSIWSDACVRVHQVTHQRHNEPYMYGRDWEHGNRRDELEASILFSLLRDGWAGTLTET